MLIADRVPRESFHGHLRFNILLEVPFPSFPTALSGESYILQIERGDFFIRLLTLKGMRDLPEGSLYNFVGNDLVCVK